MDIDLIWNKFKPIIDIAIEEDISSGDITTNAILEKEKIGKAKVISKDRNVIAGLPFVEKILKYFDSSLEIIFFKQDGDVAENREKVLEISGNLKSIISIERILLNMFQHLSGIATMTHKYVEELKDSNTKLLDTRKTLPGYRMLEKYAVLQGKGKNHRLGLYDMYMIKENHIEMAGNISNAIKKVRIHKDKENKLIEVEVKNLEEVQDALNSYADIILLDNMDNLSITKAVKLIDKKSKIEVSGNITIGRLKNIARIGVDYISVGAITHSAKAADFSMLIE